MLKKKIKTSISETGIKIAIFPQRENYDKY